MILPERLGKQELVDLLIENVRASGKNEVRIQAGHFPLRYDATIDALREDLNVWGAFSTYTFDVGCAIASRVRDHGITPSLFLLADDHKYQSEYEAQRVEHKANGRSGAQWKKIRKRFWREHSGPDARMTEAYEAIIDAHGIDYADILRQDQRKSGRTATPYHSEMVLRAQGNVPLGECSLQDPSKCRAEYAVVLRDLTSKDTALVSFIPLRCYDGVNDALLLGTNQSDDTIVPHLRELDHTHVFLPSDEQPTQAHLESGTRRTAFVDTRDCVIIDSSRFDRSTQYVLTKNK